MEEYDAKWGDRVNAKIDERWVCNGENDRDEEWSFELKMLHKLTLKLFKYADCSI